MILNSGAESVASGGCHEQSEHRRTAYKAFHSLRAVLCQMLLVQGFRAHGLG